MISRQNTDIKSQHPMLLLEIGTEEIPARFLPDAILKLKENAEKIFTEYRLVFTTIKTYATPRRLSLIAEIEPLQQAAEKEIWGPPVNVAFDKDGNPTKAAEAFAKNNGIEIKDLIKKKKGKGTYVAALIREDAQKTFDLLDEILPKIINSLNFPKTMRWGNGSLRFARPIHWILSTYNNRKIEFEIDDLKSSNMTRGHRFLSPAAFEIKDSRAYINLLRNNFVVLDPEERKNIIYKESQRLAASVNASMIEDEELLEHVSFLVEYPMITLGSFPEDYLSLPKELLITVMKGHQKYFALQDNQQRLVNHFIVVSNTKSENSETIKRGAEKVIKARFEDAKFYYEEDKKIRLDERLDVLKKVIYHDKLGSLYDKSLRIAAIADFIADKCFRQSEGFEQLRQNTHTAAMLSKTDLTSGVVGEFPELQGIMGGYYALHDKYNIEISQAISEHYLPAHSGDRLPQSDIGAIVSISDKIDNIGLFFAIGITPTGTEDPFALRRQALGVISILMDRKYHIAISEILNKALEPLDFANKSDILDSLMEFFEQRIESFLSSSGYPFDSISSVIGFIEDSPLYSIKERIEAIQKLKEDPNYEEFLLAVKRVNNITPQGYAPPVDSKLFVQQEEKELHKSVEHITPRINSLLDGNQYYDAIKTLMTINEPINRFFDKVLVMDKDEKIKQNRLSLLKNIQTLSGRIADFSKLRGKHN